MWEDDDGSPVVVQPPRGAMLIKKAISKSLIVIKSDKI